MRRVSHLEWGSPKHPQSRAHARLLRLERVEQGVSKVSLVDWSSMALDIVVQVVVVHLENPREQREEPSVDCSCEVCREFGDLVHEWVDAGGHLVEGLELVIVEVELGDTVRFALLGLQDSAHDHSHWC